MKYLIRQVTAEDIRPAFDLLSRVFMEYEAPGYDIEAIEWFQKDLTYKQTQADIWLSGSRLMFVALDNDNLIGMIDAKENGHIQHMGVDGDYHRQGIGTELMNHAVCALKLRGLDKLTLDSSPYGLPFYLNYGFLPAGTEQKKDGFVFTPMVYEPKEIWDVLDAKGNKTGRYIERGRKMAAEDYHLVVQIWKYNGKNEWLINKRAPNRGTSIDGKWETTGGAALSGDDSLTAALRESREELGLELDPKKGTLFHRVTHHGYDGHKWLQDAWVFRHDCPIEAVRFQESETCEAIWATPEKIREMMAKGEFLSDWFYPYFDEMVEMFTNGKKG